MEMVLEMVRRQDTWQHHNNRHNTVYPNSPHGVECRLDAGNGADFTHPSGN